MHLALAEYLAAHAVEPDPRSDGSLLLVFDINTRVICHTALQGDLVLEHELCTLPLEPREQERLLQQLGEGMAARLPWQLATLVLTEEDTVALQQRVSARCDRNELEAGLMKFMEAVGHWRRALGLEQGE